MKYIFLVLSAIILTSCSHIRLADPSNCSVDWEERKPCITENECAPTQVCTFRYGLSVGKCSDLDCCDPWRDRNLKTGANWCEDNNLEQLNFK